MSKRYWVIAPYDSTSSDIFEKVWEYDLANGTIAIGWDELGDVSKLNKSEIKSRYEKIYGGKPGEISYGTNTIWKFYHEIKVGDVVIARCGRMKIRGIGTVTSQTFFDEKMGIERVGGLTDDTCSNFIKVEWNATSIEFGKIVFSYQTISEISEEKYKSLTQSVTLSTGYWTFFCNPAKWEIDKFLASNIESDTYQVTKWQANSFKPGQIGIIRVGIDRRTKAQLDGRQRIESGIYAIVAILSEAQKRKNPPDKFWTNWTEAEMEKPIVKIRYLKNLLKSPLLLDDLKQDSNINDKYLLRGFQASSMPLEEASFERIIQLIDNGDQIFENVEPETAETPQAILELEQKYSNAVPKVKEVVSRRIERGTIANKLKKVAKYKCLICNLNFARIRRNLEYHRRCIKLCPH